MGPRWPITSVCQGSKTLLIDRHDLGRATDAGAGILAPESSGYRSEVWFNFALAAVGYYPSLIEKLRADQGGQTSYAQCGKLTVAVADEELGEFERAEQLIFARQQRRGQPAPQDLHLISSTEAQKIFPTVGSDQAGHLPSPGGAG